MRPVICVDLDGVLAFTGTWRGVEHFGNPIPGSVAFTRSLAEEGHVIIYSCRGSMALDRRKSPEELESIMARWLLEHGYVFDDIWTGPGKPVADLYIDDRAVSCRPEKAINPISEYNQTIKLASSLCSRPFDPIPEDATTDNISPAPLDDDPLGPYR